MSSDLRGFWKEASAPAKKKKPKRKYEKKKTALEKRRDIKFQKAKAKAGVNPIGAPHRDYTKDDKFYKTREWRTIRMAALKNSEGVCTCCGARASDGVQLHVDHIIPRYKAPNLSLDINNVQILCDDCNMGTGAWDDTDWRDHWKSL